MGKVICPCKNVTKKDIKKAIENGATTFKEVKQKTKVATSCGKCKKRAKRYFAKNLKKAQK